MIAWANTESTQHLARYSNKKNIVFNSAIMGLMLVFLLQWHNRTQIQHTRIWYPIFVFEDNFIGNTFWLIKKWRQMSWEWHLVH